MGEAYDLLGRVYQSMGDTTRARFDQAVGLVDRNLSKHERRHDGAHAHGPRHGQRQGEYGNGRRERRRGQYAPCVSNRGERTGGSCLAC